MLALLLDSAIGRRAVAAFLARGYDVVHVRDYGLQEADDDVILARAMAEDRIVVTMDLDFGNLLALTGQWCPGVIILRLGAPTSDGVTAALTELTKAVPDDELRSSVVIVEPDRIRVRKFPISGGIE